MRKIAPNTVTIDNFDRNKYPVRATFANGTVHRAGKLDELGRRTGKWYEFHYYMGQYVLRSTSHYEHDVLEGTVTYYSLAAAGPGKWHVSDVYYKSRGQTIRHLACYQGVVTGDFPMHPSESGHEVIHGLVKEYYHSEPKRGRLLRKYTCVDGVTHGRHVRYSYGSNNTTRKTVSQYSNGIEEGLESTYVNGALVRRRNFVRRKCTGWELYFVEGQLTAMRNRDLKDKLVFLDEKALERARNYKVPTCLAGYYPSVFGSALRTAQPQEFEPENAELETADAYV
jgi:hypothetical protein